jgi:AbrB family looped-hinge helix DNA binding protein
MELAKITADGQLTLPTEIRRKLNVNAGSKVAFFEENGHIIIENAGMLALKNAREMMDGVAEHLGLKDDRDVIDLIKKTRQERREEKSFADHD